MLQDILAALPLGFFLAFLIGPVFFVLLETAAMRGFRAAFSFDLGVVLADIIFLCIAYFGTNQLLLRIKDDPALFLFGGTVLTTYGIISFLKIKKTAVNSAKFQIQKLKRKDYLSIAGKGFLLNFINIGVLGFWLGLIIVFGPTLDMQPNRLITFFSTILITYLIIDVFKILAAKKLNKKLTPARVAMSKKLISIIIIVFGVVLIFRGLFPEQTEKFDPNVEEIMPST